METIRIRDIAFGGDGVGVRERDGKVVLVPFVAKGELVEVEMVQENKRMGRARIWCVWLNLRRSVSRRVVHILCGAAVVRISMLTMRRRLRGSGTKWSSCFGVWESWREWRSRIVYRRRTPFVIAIGFGFTLGEG
jgi:predicted RNA-binding protein with TRAM domain